MGEQVDRAQHLGVRTHHANSLPDELFDRAAAREAVQNPVQHAAAGRRTGVQTPKTREEPKTHNRAPRGSLRVGARQCANGKKWSRGDSNPRAATRNAAETGDSDVRAAPGAARSATDQQMNAELRRLVDAWLTLPAPVRTGILAMIKATETQT